MVVVGKSNGVTIVVLFPGCDLPSFEDATLWKNNLGSNVSVSDLGANFKFQVWEVRVKVKGVYVVMVWGHILGREVIRLHGSAEYVDDQCHEVITESLMHGTLEFLVCVCVLTESSVGVGHFQY